MRFALLVLYAAGTLAAPVLDERYPKADIKIVECSGSRFRPGATFEYEYNGETVHRVEGTTDKETGLRLNANVLITHLEGCAFHMTLTNVGLLTKSMTQEKFTESAESAAYKAALTKHDLLFTMKGNGVTSVRPHSEENVEMLNIKRGILSTLNLDETATTESDVHGTCDTKIVQEGGVVIKSKKLSDCSDRVREEIGIQSSTIKTSSNMKPLDSKSTCAYTLNNGDISKVVCEETHLFRPFSGSYQEKTSGALTAVKQTLKFVKKGPIANIKIDRSRFTATKSVTYDHTTSVSEAASLPPAIEAVMKRLVVSSAKETSANEFTSLVKMLRVLQKREMTALWNKYFDCTASKVCAADDTNMKDLYKQFMLDAIAYCGTPTCVSVVKKVTISGDVDGERANMFLQSIALVAKTTTTMIRDILDIAEKKPTRQVFLTLGTLINRHCSKMPEDCSAKSGSAVVDAENFLVKTLGDCSGQENHERVEEILLTLKAIGNAKRPASAQSSIIRCAVKSQHSNVTLSSFEALRGMPCGDALGELQEVVSNENLDADKRIHAFRAAMKCPSKDNLEILIHHYNLETNKQLASYMWTYFTNLLESTNPDDKQAIATLTAILKETPLKTTDLSMFQYSKHFEKSLYVDSIETGATAKADLVFHPDGFLPKTASFDMSAKVMGVPMDIIQTAVGIDGVENVLENMFGPDGAIPKDFALKMFNWTLTAEKLKELAGKEDEKTRTRRAAGRNDMPMVSDIHDAINKKPSQPSGFMSLRIMGQEVRMMSYDDIYAMIDQIDNMNVIQLLVAAGKGGKKTFSKSVMFLEMTHAVPTGLGLPLRLSLAGSTVGTVDMEGKFDIRNMFWGKGAMNVNGFVKSSAVVEISGSMSTESMYVSTGMRVVSNMMVEEMVKGSILYKSGQMLKINLDTPEKPVQLFKMASTPFMFLNENYDKVEGVPRVLEKDACFKSQLIGYGLCTSVRVPLAFREYGAPYFPLTGPAHFGVSLVRGDDRLTTFQFLTTMTKQGNGLTGVIEFSTPGAVYERKLSGKMSYTDINNQKTLTVSSEKFGRTGALKVSYNTVSRRTELEVKHNFLTTKDITTRILFFNESSATSKQMGLQLTADYDWYKFKHVTKFVAKDDKYMVEVHTEYWPKKSVTAALEFNSAEKQMRAIFDINQVRQAIEIIGRLTTSAKEKGVTFTFVHVPTQKTAQLYTGYKTGDNKKEIVTSLNIMGKEIKNILGWYKTGDIQRIEDLFSFQGKTAKIGASWENRKDEVAIQLIADVFGRKALSTAVYNDKGAQKFLDLSARLLDKEISTSMVLTNKPEEKSLVLRLNSVAKPTETSIGYYNKNGVVTLKVAAKGFDNRAKVFVTVDPTQGYKTSLGFGFNKYAGGVKGTFADNKGCASVFYKTPVAEKTAMKACGELKQVAATKQFLITLELPQMNQKLVLDNKLLIEAGHTNMNTKMVHNDRELGTNDLDVVYRGITDASLAMDLKSIAANGGFKVFSKKPAKSAATEIGMEVSAMDKTVLLLNKYEPGKIGTTIVVNGKPLPVSTQLAYVMGDAICETSFAINMGKYSLKTTANLLHKGKYGIELSSVVLRESASLFGLTLKEYAEMTGKKTTVVQKAGVIIDGKEYVYGWTLGYENLSSGAKRVHAVSAQIHYSTTRSSTITFTLADSENKSSLNVDVEYIPTKRVSHFITYNKNMNQLEASVEFLPKMFAKLSSRLEKGEGYMLQTTASLEWTGFKKSITIINSFINNDKTFMISTNLAKDLSIGLRVNKLTPKSITVFGDFFGNRVQLEASYEKMNLGLKLVVNGKTIFSVKGGYDQWAKAVRILAVQQEKVLLDIKSSYNAVRKSFNLALAGLTKWGGIYVTQREHRNILTINVLGKPFGKVILNTKDMSLTIHTLQYPRFSVSWKWISKSKTLQMTMKTLKNRMMVNLRMDWTNKILAINGFLNKERVGAKLFFVKRAMIFKVTLSPRNIIKATFTKGNNQIRLNLQRIIKGKPVSQVAFAYAFNTKLSEVMFKFNAELLKKIGDFVRPILANAVTDGKEFLERIKNSDKKLVELSKDVQENIIVFLRKIDQSIQSFDIEPFRKTLTTSGAKLFKQLSELTVELLKTLADGLDNIKANTPKTAAKVRELVKSAKQMYTQLAGNVQMSKQELEQKVKMVIEMVEKLLKQGEELLMTATKEGRALVQKGITRGKDMIVKGQALLKTLTADVEKRLVPIKKIIDAFVKATTPVVEKFVQLTKDFKLRGMRLEDIAVKAKAEGEKLLKEYIAKIKVIIARLEKETMTQFVDARTKAIELWNKYKADSYKTLREVEEYAMNLRVPYTNRNVKQIVERIRAEIVRLVQWARTVNVNQVIADTRKTVTGIITAKTEMLKKRMDELVGRLNKLRVYVPKVTREMYEKVVAVVTKYIKEVNVLVNQAVEFAKPMREYFTLVEASLSKHFGPLLDQITLPQFLNLVQNMPDMQALFDKEIRPILTKLMPVYKNAVKQIRSIKVGGFHLGPLFDMQMNEVRGQLEDAMTAMKKEMISLRKLAYEAKSMSPKWFVQTSIDASVRVIGEIVDYMKYLYKNGDVVIEKALKKVEAVQKRLNYQYSRITAKSFDQVTEDILKLSEDSVTTTAGELSNVIRQLIAMDISGPTWKALTDIDVAGRMKRMGVDWKIRRALKYAKQANVTGLVMNAITRIQEFINLGIKETSIKAIAMYEQMDKVYKYLKSIPKKDYETWLKEAAAFTMSTRDLVELKIVKIYETSKLQAAAARKFLAKINQLEMSKYQDMAMESLNKVTNFVTVIGEKSALVYKDLEQPTINMLNHYRSVIVPLVKKYYTIIKNRLTTEFHRISTQLQRAVVQLRTRAEGMFRDLQVRVANKMSQIMEIIKRISESAVAEYKQFMAKYGHLTWEEVYARVQAGGIQELQRLRTRLNMYYRQIVVKVNELRATITAKAMEVYKVLLSEAKALIGKYEAEIEKLRSEVMAKVEELRTRAMAYYSKYEKQFIHYKDLAKVEIDRLRAELEAMVNEVKSRAIALYNANKDKTMKQIVEEIKKIFNAAYLKHKLIVEAIAEKNFDEAKKLIGEAQTQVMGQFRSVEADVMTLYRSLETKFNAKVLPELKSAYKKLLIAMPELQGIIDDVVAEGKSISKQLLRNTIIMGETITKAYGPHITAAKDVLKKYVELLKTSLPEILARWEKFLTKALDEMEIAVRACLKSCEKQVMKLLSKAKSYFDDTIKATEKLIQVTVTRMEKKIRAIIAEIRNNPEVKEYVVMVEVKLAQLKKMIEELIKKLETNPTLIKLRGDIKQKVDELKVIFDEEFKRITSDPRFKELTLNIQIRLDQIQAYVKAKYAELRKLLREIIAGRTAFVNAKLEELKRVIDVRVKETRMMVAGIEAKLEPVVKEVVALLKQISKSGKFTIEQIQKYMTPQMEELIKTVTYFANMFPKFVQQAVLYVRTNPEEALSNAVKVTKGLIKEILNVAKTTKPEDVEKTIFDFYTKVVAKTNEVYAAVTDEWTKKTVIKIREYVKTAIAELMKQTLKLKTNLEALPEVMKMYYTKALPILKKMINGKLGDLNVLFKQYTNLLTIAVADNYSKVKTILETHMKTIEALAKDCTALAQKYLEISIETMKKYWNTLPFKTIVDNQFWSDVAAEIKSHELFQLTSKTVNIIEAKVKTLATKIINIFVKFIKTKGAMIENELKALKTEALKQAATLNTQGRRIYRRSIDQADAMVAHAAARYNAMVADVEAQYGTLLSDITAGYKDIIKQITMKYKMIVETMEKVYETATIGQIVDYVEKQAAKMDTQFKVLQAKYMAELKAFIEEYRIKISKLSVKDQMEMIVKKIQAFRDAYIAMMDPYYQKFEKFVNNYKTLLVTKFERITNRMMKEFKKLSAKAVAEFKTLSALVVARYEKYVAEMKAKYGKDFEKMMAKVNGLINKFNKMSAEMIATFEKMSAEIMLKYKSLRGDLLKVFDEVEARIERIRLAFWKRIGALEAMLRTKMTAVKKMTVQETVDVLIKIPAELKSLTKMTITELIQALQKMRSVLTSELRTYLAKAEVLYNNLKKIVLKERVRVQALLKQLKLKVKEIIKVLTPYFAELKQGVFKAQKEVIDTATFVYNYYNLGEKFQKLEKFLMAEIMKIIKQTKDLLPFIRQYIEDYRHQLQMASEEFTGVATSYARDAQDFTYTTYKSLRTTTVKTGDQMLRAIHKGLVYWDTLDQEILMTKLRDLVEFVKKHITVIQKEGQVIIKMIHPNLSPVIARYTNAVKTQAQLTYEQLQTKGQKLLNNIEVELPKLQAKITALKKQIQEAVMKSTFDIRRDLNISYKVNKNIVLRLYKVVTRVVTQRYAAQMQRFAAIRDRLVTLTTKGQLLTEATWKQFTTLLQQAYGNAETIIMDIAEAPTPKAMYEKIIAYINKAVTLLETKYQPLLVSNLGTLEAKVSAFLMKLKTDFTKLKEKDLAKMFVDYMKSQEISRARLDAYIAILKNAVVDTTGKMEKVLALAKEQMKTGYDMKMAMKLQGVWERLIEMMSSIDVRGSMCKIDPELCQLVDEGVEVHKVLLNKYLAYLSVGKAQVDRVIRELNTKVSDTTAQQKYLATAMIMGNHILTFDGKLYDMVNFPKTKKGSPSPCSYLLARDFQDKKFTISKLDNAIIVETPQMTVKIRDDGQTKTTVGNGMSFGLPVESGKSTCIRIENLIMCHFVEQGLKVTVDLKNFFTSISVSGWYKGKSQGLLGTLNNEAHDDWRLPNNMITSNINEFLNAYELSGKSVCKLNPKTDNAKQCDGKTSKMCAAYFDAEATTPSPFARFFKEVDPKPFMEACVRDTKCKRANKKSHCGVVAAYNALLRTKGFWIPQANECMMEKGKRINQVWTVKPTKMIDVVVMVSQHTNMNKLKRPIAATMLNLHKNLRTQGKFNVRYALVGFGGSGVHEAAHVHALRRGQSIFGYVHDVRTEIKSMPFEGKGDVTNDGYHAIMTANRLKFRPGAEKVFIMFNTVPHKSHPTGPSYDETKFIMAREANAPLFVFDSVNFQKFAKHSVGRVIGQTERKVYTTTNLKGITSKDLQMPASEFRQLVLISKGGLFSNIIKNPKQTAVSLHDAVTRWVKADMTTCKRCVLRGSWTGQSRAVCHSVQC